MFALDCGLLEIFTEKVLRARPTPVTRVASHRHDQVVVSLVIGENALETIAQVKEIGRLGHATLQDLWLDRGAGPAPFAVGARNSQEFGARSLGQILSFNDLCLLLVIVIVDEAGVVLVVLVRFQGGVIDPSAEVLWVEIAALGRGETVFRLRGRLFASVQLCGHLREALRHETLIDETFYLACVIGHVLPAHFVRRATDPVDCVLAVVAVHVGVDELGRGKIALLLLVPCKLHLVQASLVTASHTDLSIDTAGRFTEHGVLAGDEARVARDRKSVV